MKKYLMPILIIALFFSVFAAAWPQKPSKTTAPSDTKVIVYYFHNNYRCPSCKKIEAYTHEAVNAKFAADLKKGSMTWQMINVDEPANKHFVKEYNIFTKQVVLVEMKKGVQTRWKNLDKIWNLLGNKDQFTSYIEQELKAFKGGS
ncbi:MAG: nitrophenyl compound nitroreductase subunit ArsF family protein [Candidatus Xenobiia bacterium LiM19]